MNYRCGLRFTVDPTKLETGLSTISAGIPYVLLLRIEAFGCPTFGLLLQFYCVASAHRGTLLNPSALEP